MAILAVDWGVQPPAVAAEEVVPSCALIGSVLDPHGGALRDADVVLLSSSLVSRARARTNQDGTFSLPALTPGDYVLEARAGRFVPTQRLLHLAGCPFGPVELRLAVDGVNERVTVTPMPSESRRIAEAPQLVTITDQRPDALQPNALVPELLWGAVGVSVQKTTTSQASPFVRGLTGQHVVGLIDGVRFNTATFRPGANQYLAFIDAASVDRIEVVRGPGAVAYGSDALGGTINVLTRDTGWGRPRFGVQGSTALALASADTSAGVSTLLAGGSRQWGFVVDGSLRSHGDLRPGRGIDSRSVATRLLGLPSSVLGTELAQTGYRQRSVSFKADLRPRDPDRLVIQYMHGSQQGASRYDQLNGGSGNLVHRFDPQALDFGVVRYDRTNAGPLDTVSLRGSYNRQQDDRTVQNVNNQRLGLQSPFVHEKNATAATGLQLTATRAHHPRHRAGAGLEWYDETVSSSRFDRQFDAATGVYAGQTDARGRYPDGATFRTVGVFGNYSWNVVDQLTLSGAVRYSHFTYAQDGASSGGASIASVLPPYRNVLGDTTYQGGAVWAIRPDVVATVHVSRGFRAPNVNDRGTIGLSGNGFEIPPEEAVRLGAVFVPFGSSLRADTAPAVEMLAPERLWNYEAGLRVNRGPVSASLAAFRSDLFDLIKRDVILLPPGAAGGRLGGEEIVRQDATGAVYTALASTPVFVRTNAGHVRMNGLEGSTSVRLTGRLSVEANASYIRGEDRGTGRPPGLENGIPPLHGSIVMRWQPPNERWWMQASGHLAASQRRLSPNDLAQARIGGFRTPSAITQFFNNGAVARGLVSNGLLLATGETVTQVVTRVLGAPDAPGAPMFTRNKGYAILGIAWGIRLGRRSTTVLAVDNITDANYRVMGSGVDGPGRNLRLTHTMLF